MIGWFLLAVVCGLALFNPWWWIGVAVVGLWKLNQWYFYKSRPWKRVHYPMMRAYAGASGLEHGEASRENREFDIKRALRHLLSPVFPDWTAERIESFIDREYSRCESFTDGALLKDYVQTLNKALSDKECADIVQHFQKAFVPTDKGLMVRMVIAGIIEKQYGPLDRGEYLYQVLMGNAK